MSKFIVRYILTFAVLVLAQALVFNRMVLFNVAVPFVFLYLIIFLPVTLGPNIRLTLGFLTGLAVDVFSDTPGLNALACTVVSFMRNGIFHLYVPLDDDLSGRQLSLKTMGSAAYMKYLLTVVVIYSVLLFSIEAFQFFNLRLLLLRMSASAVYTFIMILAIDTLTLSRSEKKL